MTVDDLGNAQTDHLAALEEAGIEIPAHLLPPPCPEELQYILGWYYQLGATRDPPGLSGQPCAIRYSEIVAWQRCFGIKLTRFELNTLLILDAVYRSTAAEILRKKDKPGGK